MEAIRLRQSLAEIAPGTRASRVIDQAQGSGAVSFGELELDPGHGFRLHRHKVEEAVFIVEGKARFTVADETFETEGDAVALMPAGVAHRVENIGDSTLRLVFFFPAVNVDREWCD
jgi:quercetin dioxygenase-like cupin family protein